jgi:hypothetical protein
MKVGHMSFAQNSCFLARINWNQHNELILRRDKDDGSINNECSPPEHKADILQKEICHLGEGAKHLKQIFVS